MTKPREIKAQNRNAKRAEPLRNPARGGDILGARKAMGEDRGGQMRAIGHVQPRGKLRARVAGKGDTGGGHWADFRFGLPRVGVFAALGKMCYSIVARR